VPEEIILSEKTERARRDRVERAGDFFMSEPADAILSPDVLRAKAAQCMALASQASSPELADQLRLFAREYAEMARRLEAPFVIATMPRTGGIP
jgi:hypothetical protein